MNSNSRYIEDNCRRDKRDDNRGRPQTAGVTNQSLLTLGLTITNATLSALTANRTNHKCC